MVIKRLAFIRYSGLIGRSLITFGTWWLDWRKIYFGSEQISGLYPRVMINASWSRVVPIQKSRSKYGIWRQQHAFPNRRVFFFLFFPDRNHPSSVGRRIFCQNRRGIPRNSLDDSDESAADDYAAAFKTVMDFRGQTRENRTLVTYMRTLGVSK